MGDQSAVELFKKSSTTYFFSSLFFPSDIRDKVTTLYAFVRTADDFVDAIPQDRKGFSDFVHAYTAAVHGTPSNNKVIDDFVALANEHQFEQSWTDAFLKAMALDMYKSEYQTIEETSAYMYGSAEVIGLMLSKIMRFDESSYGYARLLGRSMQYCNMIRDVAEDCQLGRQYIPRTSLKKFDLSELSEKEAKKNEAAFCALMQHEIKRYYLWESEARNGYAFMPKRLKVPIATATEMYCWAMEQIEADPMIVWRKKVKPDKLRVLKTGMRYLTEFYPYDN